jgi:hypothetical protein
MKKLKPFLQGHKKTSHTGRFEKVNHYIISEIKVFAITTQAACFSFFLFTWLTRDSNALSNDSSNDLELDFTKNW